MGTDDFFKKRRADARERKKEFRTPKPNSFLIVSEGEKTEPLYFEGLANYINQKFGKGIDVEKPIINTKGEGKGTVSLVNAAEKLVARASFLYSQVWIAFDKDDFQDFDQAVTLAEQKGYRVAWSNQSFEYWIYLHFNYSDSALHRHDWVDKLSKLFKEKKISPKGYEKNDSDVFAIVTARNGLKNAVNNALKIERAYDSRMKPSQQDPCTKVHHLILELKPYLSELLE
jgi:hypothetical protein